MDRIDAHTLKQQYPDGLELTFKTFCCVDTGLIGVNQRDYVSKILSALEGSKVKVFLIPFGKDSSEAYIQLRRGEYRSEEIFLDHISRVVDLMPFIATCAGPADEVVEPSRLEQLERRVEKLERATFPEHYEN